MFFVGDCRWKTFTGDDFLTPINIDPQTDEQCKTACCTSDDCYGYGLDGEACHHGTEAQLDGSLPTRVYVKV